VIGVEQQNFPLISQLHLREPRSPLRSRSDDLPLTLHLIFDPSSPLRFAHVGSARSLRFPLRSHALFCVVPSCTCWLFSSFFYRQEGLLSFNKVSERWSALNICRWTSPRF